MSGLIVAFTALLIAEPSSLREMERALDHCELERVAERAPALAKELAGSDPQQAELLWQLAFFAARRLGRPAAPLAAEVLTSTRPPPLGVALGHDALVEAALQRNDFETARAEQDRTLVAVRPLLESKDPRRRQLATLIAAYQASFQTARDDELRLWERAIDAARETQTPRALVRAMVALSYRFLELAQFERAAHVIDEALALAEQHDLPLFVGLLQLARGYALGGAAQASRESVEAFRRATETFETCGRPELAANACVEHTSRAAVVSPEQILPDPVRGPVPAIERSFRPRDCLRMAKRVSAPDLRAHWSQGALGAEIKDVERAMVRRTSGNLGLLMDLSPAAGTKLIAAETKQLGSVLEELGNVIETSANASSVEVAQLRAARGRALGLLGKGNEAADEARRAMALVSPFPPLNSLVVDIRRALVFHLQQAKQLSEAQSVLRGQIELETAELRRAEGMLAGKLPAGVTKEAAELYRDEIAARLLEDRVQMAELLEMRAGLSSSQPRDIRGRAILSSPSPAENWLAIGPHLSAEQSALLDEAVAERRLAMKHQALDVQRLRFELARVHAYRGDLERMKDAVLEYAKHADDKTHPTAVEILRAAARLAGGTRLGGELSCELGNRLKRGRVKSDERVAAYRRCEHAARSAKDRRTVARALLGLADVFKKDREKQAARKHWLEEALALSDGASTEEAEEASGQLARLLAAAGEEKPAAELYLRQATIEHDLGSHDEELRTLADGAIAVMRDLVLALRLTGEAAERVVRDQSWEGAALAVMFDAWMALDRKSPELVGLVWERWRETPRSGLPRELRFHLDLVGVLARVGEKQWSDARASLDELLRDLPAEGVADLHRRTHVFRALVAIAPNVPEGVTWYHRTLATLVALRKRWTAEEASRKIGDDGHGLDDRAIADEVRAALRGWVSEEDYGFQPKLRWPPQP